MPYAAELPPGLAFRSVVSGDLLMCGEAAPTDSVNPSGPRARSSSSSSRGQKWLDHCSSVWVAASSRAPERTGCRSDYFCGCGGAGTHMPKFTPKVHSRESNPCHIDGSDAFYH